MNGKISFTTLSLMILLSGGCGPDHQNDGSSGSGPDQSRGKVNVGDTQKQVNMILGAPNIEYPDGDKMVRWYAEYEVTTKDDVVIDVKRTQAGIRE